MRRSRLFLASLVALALAPGTFVRAPQPEYTLDGAMWLVELDPEPARAGPFLLEDAWQIVGEPIGFGGFSALVPLDNGRMLAGTDNGWRFEFGRPDSAEFKPRVLGLGPRQDVDKFARDLESLARDPETGEVWAGYEMVNSIARYNRSLELEKRVRPEALSEWSDNAGPESLARFADGRFLVISEEEERWDSGRHRAVLFAGDPVEGAAARTLALQGIPGYRPVDLVALDAGRALVLFRDLRFGLPPRFATAIGMIDIDRPLEDGAIGTRQLAILNEGFPAENYEGIAITEDADGTHVWLISDDNFMSFQRTLLLKLRWQAREKARE